jgi:hypothetical protein
LRRPANTISVDDNFFDLGGHSLMATQVVSRLRRVLNFDIPLRTLFEGPTLGGLAERVIKGGVVEPEIPPIVKVARDRPLPVSFAQQRLWVLDRIEPNNPLYNIARPLRMKGELKTDTLVRALNEIVRRHESLRTTFAASPDGEPVEVIADSLTLPVPIVDLSTRPEGDRETGARELAAEQAGTPFNLATGPLLRAMLLKLDARDHILLLTMHHIISDAWSAGVFVEELGVLYRAFCAGEPSPLAELTIQYGDYAAWQRQYMQGEALEYELAYWREHLKDAPTLLELPTDYPRPSQRTFAGAWEPVPLAKDVSESVRTFSHAKQVTPFMTLFSGFGAMLSRYSGVEHIVLGTDVANRTTIETERLIGFFINLLPLHTDLSGDPSFSELVSRVREAALGAYAHQDLPFDKLVHELRPERSSSHNPIVQAIFVMQNVPTQKRELTGLELSVFPTPVARSKFDIAVFMTDDGHEMTQHWVYSTELFGRGTILRLARHFENVLRHGLLQPETRLSAIEMLSEHEREEAERARVQRKDSKRKKLMSVDPKGIRIPEEVENR